MYVYEKLTMFSSRLPESTSYAWSFALTDYLAENIVSTHQGRALSLAKRSTVVDCGHALLFVGKQRLDHERFHARIVQPSGKTPSEIVQSPRWHVHAGLGELGVQLFLAVA